MEMFDSSNGTHVQEPTHKLAACKYYGHVFYHPINKGELHIEDCGPSNAFLAVGM